MTPLTKKQIQEKNSPPALIQLISFKRALQLILKADSLVI